VNLPHFNETIGAIAFGAGIGIIGMVALTPITQPGQPVPGSEAALGAAISLVNLGAGFFMGGVAKGNRTPAPSGPTTTVNATNADVTPQQG
jgi:hypothetical protein